MGRWHFVSTVHALKLASYVFSYVLATRTYPFHQKSVKTSKVILLPQKFFVYSSYIEGIDTKSVTELKLVMVKM